jgi:DNA-3-methyladenine glycosylase
MHWCLNVVCEKEGRASAVLLRAGEVVEGEPLARERRGERPPAVRLASGPANLAAALGVDAERNGTDLLAPGATLRLERGAPVADEEVLRGPRVGVSRAAETPWRFFVAGNPCVSAPRRAGG